MTSAVRLVASASSEDPLDAAVAAGWGVGAEEGVSLVAVSCWDAGCGAIGLVGVSTTTGDTETGMGTGVGGTTGCGRGGGGVCGAGDAGTSTEGDTMGAESVAMMMPSVCTAW
jgi:hypothetical protein